jgi:hypothetical protein
MDVPRNGNAYRVPGSGFLGTGNPEPIVTLPEKARKGSRRVCEYFIVFKNV